jgi:hypothetical protein
MQASRLIPLVLRATLGRKAQTASTFRVAAKKGIVEFITVLDA